MELIITGILSSLGTAGIIIYVFIKYYNNVRKIFSDICSFFAATFGWFKAKSTKLSIETNCTTSIERMNKIVPELNLPELSIDWVKSDDHGKVMLEPGKAIVLLKYDKDNTQNIINTTASYIQKTLLYNSKPFLDYGIRKAIDFAVIREFLYKTPQKNYIVSQYLEDCTEEIHQYSDAFNKVIKVEDEGLLTRVLIREYAVWGNKLTGKTRNEDLVLESKRFLDYIFNIASRDFDELTPLVFNNNTLKVAILLVAKYDTYSEKGIEPYVRRIREGFANGINTFYLLARNEKIDILKNVYGEIISTGNYNLLNGPEVYKDNAGRDNICYCIEVKPDADLAKAYKKLKECINEECLIEAIIIDVYKDKIICDYNGINVIVTIDEVTENPRLRLRRYYSKGMTIEIIPLRNGDGGIVYGSILKTKSNPQNLFNNQYEVGASINAIVQSVDDDYITLLVKDSNQECIAYRRNLTYSRFAFLHHLYPVGSEFQFIINDIDYLHNQLEVKMPVMIDPWKDVNYKVGDAVSFQIFNIKETCIETELKEGIFAILPYSELSWFDCDIENVKKTLKRNMMVDGYIKRLDIEQRLVVLSLKDKVSPYNTFYSSLTDEKNVKVKIENHNAYGILGMVASKYRMFIPLSETFIGLNNFNYKIGRVYNVHVKDVDKYGTSLIGTFKPFIPHPLQFVKDNFFEGQVLSHLQMIRSTEKGVYFELKGSYGKRTEALLLNSEVSNSCFIIDLNKVFQDGFSCPMILKKIDMERNVVFLSVKELTLKNENRIQTLKYGDIYIGKVIGKKSNKCYVLLENIWVEISVETSCSYEIGDVISVILASYNSFADAKDLS